jgi:hypothetical protein
VTHKYTNIDIIPECRPQPPFGITTFGADRFEWEIQPDGSIIILRREAARERKFVRFTAGQWMGRGVVTEEPDPKKTR